MTVRAGRLTMKLRIVFALLFVGACRHCEDEDEDEDDIPAPPTRSVRVLPCTADTDCLEREACACENPNCSLPRLTANTAEVRIGVCVPEFDRHALYLPIRRPDAGWLIEAADASFPTQEEANRAAYELWHL
jgi:hypothetical protein